MDRINALHRWPQNNNNLNITLDSIYQFSEILSIEDIPLRADCEHTMSVALSPYVQQKLPTSDLIQIAKAGGKIEIHGIYPKHFALAYPDDLNNHEIQFYHKPTTRKYNLVRPRFFKNQKRNKFILSLPPGSDYLRHYGTLIRHFLANNKFHCRIKIYYYPLAFHSISFWTDLRTKFVKPGDIVIIGYAQEMYEALKSYFELIPISTTANGYLESRRFRLPNGKIVNLLGVNFSFWGNLCQPIVEGICSSGADEIIYVGKLGSLTAADSLYRDIFCPSAYTTLSHTQIINQVTNLKNGLLEKFSELNSGMHVSVPTVLEEDYVQRELATGIKAKSIDNEISQMAFTISTHNETNHKEIKFSALHFATDYVRSSQERNLKTDHDLSTNREGFALTRKEFAIRNSSRYLAKYLESN